MENKFKEILEKGLKELQININEEQTDYFLRYFLLLEEWNQKINLTAIKEPEEVAVKHFLDSLAAGQYVDFQKGQKLLDLGTGAGFPGLIFKIFKQDLTVTLVDSVQKKVNFLKQVINELELGKTEALHIRAEELGQNFLYRRNYQIVTARAVASMAVLAEYCLPLLTQGGTFYALKGPNFQEELKEAEYAIKLLGGRLQEVIEYKLPVTADQRTLIMITKEKETPREYPRKSGLPVKKPLVISKG